MQVDRRMEDSKVLWFWFSRLSLIVLFITKVLPLWQDVFNILYILQDLMVKLLISVLMVLALISQADAELESAQKRAAAIKIMGQTAKDFPEYRQQEFIGAFAHAIQDGKIEKMWFVPTEANIPIITQHVKP